MIILGSSLVKFTNDTLCEIDITWIKLYSSLRFLSSWCMWVQLQIWKKVHPHLFCRSFFPKNHPSSWQADGPVLPLGEPCATHAPGRVTRTSWQSAAGCFKGGARQGHSRTSPLRWGELFGKNNWWWVMSGDAKWFANFRGFIFWMHVLLPSLRNSCWKKWNAWCSMQTFHGNICWNNHTVDVLTLFGRVNHMNASRSIKLNGLPKKHHKIMQWTWRPCGSMWVIDSCSLGGQDSFFIMTFFQGDHMVHNKESFWPSEAIQKFLNEFAAFNSWKSDSGNLNTSMERLSISRRAFVTATRPFPKMPRAIFLLTKRCLPWPGPILPRWVAGEHRKKWKTP